ncbi:MAG: heparinase [Phycisphaerales bacterium]|nr:heparinase [Phycisphaerales bacterium]
MVLGNHVGFEPLESRIQFSSAAPAPAILAGTSLRASTVTASTAHVATALTHTDRRALIARFSGDLAASLRKTLRHSGDAAFDASLLKYMARRAGPVYFYNGRQLPRYADFVNQILPQEVASTLDKADAILAHRFPEQINSESYTVQLGTAIDWDVAPRTTDNPDFLHSLNRHGFWRDLGIAYRVTGDGRYVRELVAQLQSWSAQTPALKNPDDWAASSPHWWLLDAADRAKNWIDAYFLALGSADWTPAANTLFLKKIGEHGDFLDRVTPSSVLKNRTAIHAAGLLRVALMFPEFTLAAAWETHAVDLTFRCLGTQFYPDGGQVEETPSYQASALDAFLETYKLSELNGRTYWTKNRRRILTNSVESLYQVLSPHGQIPGLSDTYRSANPGPFLTLCGLLLGDRRYLIARPNIDQVLLVGRDLLLTNYVGDPNRLNDRGPSYALPDTGYYMLRGAESSGSSEGIVSNEQLIADAGPKGGTHGHYDLLNFEYWSDLIAPLIPDPGPFRYDNSADRAYVISTPAHNTISIEGLNHEAVEGLGSPKIVVDQFLTTATEGRFTAHHHAYEYLAGRPTVGRTLWVDRTKRSLDLMIAVDWGRSDVAHTFTTSFNLFGGGTNVVQSAPGVIDAFLTKNSRVRMQSLAVPGQQVALLDTFVSSRPPPRRKAARDARRYLPNRHLGRLRDAHLAVRREQQRQRARPAADGGV